MATRSQIIQRARLQIRQEDSATSDFTDSQLQGYLDEGIRYLATLVKWPRDIVDVQLESATPAYNLPEDFMVLRAAYYGDVSLASNMVELDVVTEDQLAFFNQSWLSEHANDRGIPQRVCLIDRATILVQPTPDTSSAATGKKLYLSYVYYPAALAADSSEPDLPLVYHDLLTDYIAYKCYMSKLNNPDLGRQLLSDTVEKAKSLEPSVTKQFEKKRMVWQTSDDPNYDDAGFIIP
jgi:hypothetical protein